MSAAHGQRHHVPGLDGARGGHHLPASSTVCRLDFRQRRDLPPFGPGCRRFTQQSADLADTAFAARFTEVSSSAAPTLPAHEEDLSRSLVLDAGPGPQLWAPHGVRSFDSGCPSVTSPRRSACHPTTCTPAADMALAEVEARWLHRRQQVGLPDGSSIVFTSPGRCGAICTCGKTAGPGWSAHRSPDVDLSTRTRSRHADCRGRSTAGADRAGLVSWTGNAELGTSAAVNLRYTMDNPVAATSRTNGIWRRSAASIGAPLPGLNVRDLVGGVIAFTSCQSAATALRRPQLAHRAALGIGVLGRRLHRSPIQSRLPYALIRRLVGMW